MRKMYVPVDTQVVVSRPHRITSHSRLSEIVEVFKAPDVKVQTKQRGIQPWEKKLRLEHHVIRMKTFAKSAESPTLTLREIQSGKKDRRTEKIILALYTYFVGVAFLFFLLGGL